MDSLFSALKSKVTENISGNILDYIGDSYPPLKKAIEEKRITISKAMISKELHRQLSKTKNIELKEINLDSGSLEVVFTMRKFLLSTEGSITIKPIEITLTNEKQEMLFAVNVENLGNDNLINRVILSIAKPFANYFLHKELTGLKNVRIAETSEKGIFKADLSGLPHMEKATAKVPVIGKSLFDVIRVGKVYTDAAGVYVDVDLR